MRSRVSGPDRMSSFELGWEVTGIGRLEKIRARKDPKHKPISQWVVCRNQEAIELMIAVYPHMGARRQAKIREVLAQVEKRPA
jgi:hypothetical protein